MSVPSGGRHLRRAPGQIHIDPARVLLGGILQPQLATDLFDSRLDLLDVVGGVVSLSHNPASHTISKLSFYPSTQQPASRMKKLTHGDESAHAPWHI